MSLDDLMDKFDDFESEGESTTPDVPEYSEMAEEPEQSVAMKSELSKRAFNQITEFSRPPQDWFGQEGYYKIALKDEGPVSVRMHEALARFFKATDSGEKQELKQRLNPLYWELHKKIMLTAITGDCPLPKKLMVRYGALLPNMLSGPHRETISSIILENITGEAVWYCDEWVKMVAEGTVNRLATDEESGSRRDGTAEIARLRSKIDKLSGTKEAMGVFLLNLQRERLELSDKIKATTDLMLSRRNSEQLNGFSLPFEATQKQAMSELALSFRALATLAKNIDINFTKYAEALTELEKAQTDVEALSSGAKVVDTSVVDQESGQIAVLAKMCVGRQGNHSPLLSGQFFQPRLEGIATRENIIKIMGEVEQIDVGIFRREFRRQINRIPPHVIIIPCYGNIGVCWEPYERNNKATSRGRIAVPMFPGDLRLAVITALGDLRWQQAKEMAAHYWMEEGITGSFFQWFSLQKIRGDVRQVFIENYVLWITKESEGMQKLDREVRGIFWRNVPFSVERRESLKERGFVYNQLYINDQNRQGAFDVPYPD